MPIRRRPLRRAAVTGAVGYAAYNKGAKNASQQSSPPPQTDAPSSDQRRADVYDEIAKLGALKEKGLLTDSEFEREKIRLLG